MKTPELKERSQDLLRETENYVRGNPIPVLCGAIAVGLVIGLLARSRDRDPEPIRDAVKEIRALLKPLAKQTRKAYAGSSDAVREAVEQAVEKARDLDVDEYVDPLAKLWRRLWS